MPGPFDNLPPNVLQNIGSHLGVKDFGHFCQVNKATASANATTLDVLKQMLSKASVPKKMKGSLLANTLAEKDILRAIIDAGLVRIGDALMWEFVPLVVQQAVAKQFERPTLKPDAVAGLRPLDFFTSNLPKAECGARPESIWAAAEVALKAGIPNEVRSKWQHYGANAVAVVNVSQFPEAMTTEAIVRELSTTVTRPTKNQSLWLVRNGLVARVFN